MYDYHVHTSYSVDSKASMKDVAQKSISLGMKELCFTDHTDFDVSGKDFAFDTDKYFEEINNYKQAYSKQIEILKGIELGIQPHILKRCEDFINSKPFDFVILSLHVCNKKDLYSDNFFNDITPEEAYTKYLEELTYCVKNYNAYNVLGHVDLIRRYNEEVAKVDSMQFNDQLKEIFKIVIENNKGIEINTGGLRYWLKDINPTYNVLKLYRDLGGEIITFGSDSHRPEDLCAGYDYAIDVLKLAGFNYITTFKNMKPKFVRI